MYIVVSIKYIQLGEQNSHVKFKGGGGGGGGGGAGVHPVFIVKLEFEKAVDQRTKAHDQTFEGVPDSGCPQDSHALIW